MGVDRQPSCSVQGFATSDLMRSAPSPWPSGEATACKAVNTGSTPVGDSKICAAGSSRHEPHGHLRRAMLVAGTGYEKEH